MSMLSHTPSSHTPFTTPPTTTHYTPHYLLSQCCGMCVCLPLYSSFFVCVLSQLLFSSSFYCMYILLKSSHTYCSSSKKRKRKETKEEKGRRREGGFSIHGRCLCLPFYTEQGSLWDVCLSVVSHLGNTLHALSSLMVLLWQLCSFSCYLSCIPLSLPMFSSPPSPVACSLIKKAWYLCCSPSH